MIGSFLVLVWLFARFTRCELPPALTVADFDDTIKQDLHLIEFFSPYCTHCKHLAPTWEATYNQFLDESSKLKVYMHQVNCIESGDLCARESILYYPLIRLYSGDGETGVFKLSYPSKYKRTEADFIRFMREQSTLTVEDLPNVSKLLSTNDLMKIMNGDLKEPILISFWPTTDEQFNENNINGKIDDDLKKQFLLDCPNCFEMRNNWGSLSNKLQNTIKTGFVNCKSNEQICHALKLRDLFNATPRNKKPILKLYIPRIGGNQINYNFDPMDSKRIIKWAEKLIENYQFQEVSVRDLDSKMNLERNLRIAPPSDIPLDSKTSLVYYYDAKTSVPEDFDILPHLLQHVMDIPFDVVIYKSSDTKFDDLMLQREKNIVRYLQLFNQEAGYLFNEDMYLMNKITSIPTFLSFTDSSLIHDKLINFSSKSIRTARNVKAFIDRNSIPYLTELTPETIKYFFPVQNPRTPEKYNKEDLVVITLIDSKDLPSSMKLRQDMMKESHEFAYLQSLEKYNKILSKRLAKIDKVNEMKLKEQHPDLIMKQLREKVDHSILNFETIFTFMDISDHANLDLINSKGWNINGRTYRPGDVLIISRYGNEYWDKDIKGDPLHSDSQIVTPTLKQIKFGSGLRSNLTKSPFSSMFRFMDVIHQHGIIGYPLFLTAIWVVFNFVKWLAKRRYQTQVVELRSRNLGILGRIPKKD